MPDNAALLANNVADAADPLCSRWPGIPVFTGIHHSLKAQTEMRGAMQAWIDVPVAYPINIRGGNEAIGSCDRRLAEAYVLDPLLLRTGTRNGAPFDLHQKPLAADSYDFPRLAAVDMPMYAIDIGTSRVIQLPASASIREAARTMKMQDSGCIVVVDSTQAGAIPIGIVTDRDISLCQATGDAIGDRTIGTVMSKPIAVCGIAASIDEIVRIMCEGHLRRLPVVNDDGTLAAIVSIDDVVAALAELMGCVARTLSANT